MYVCMYVCMYVVCVCVCVCVCMYVQSISLNWNPVNQNFRK